MVSIILEFLETSQVIAMHSLRSPSGRARYLPATRSGPAGLPAGAIADKLRLPPATLSFHLGHLAPAGLVRNRQEGRFVIYSTDFENMNALVGYLIEKLLRRR